jgi:flagellar biosynthetic protein FliO
MGTEKRCAVYLAPLAVAPAAWLAPATARAAEQVAAMGDGMQLTGNSETLTLIIAIVKVAGSLAVVVGVMLLALHLVKKLGIGRAMLQSGKLIDVIDSRMIAPKKYVALVRIADECVALGVTDQQITLLTRVSDHFQNADQNGSSTHERKNRSSFAAVLEKAAVLTGKRKADSGLEECSGGKTE